MAAAIPEPSPAFLITIEDVLGQADAEQLRTDLWLAARPERPGCRRCKVSFDPADKSPDGQAQQGDEPWCRGCVDNCHEGGTDHRCVICHNYTMYGDDD